MDNTEKIAVIKRWLGNGSINIFGLPLSGKDTQCVVLANLLDGETISSGKILRQHWDGYKNNNGRLTPVADFKRIVLPFLLKPESAEKPLVLSSIGRIPGEEKDVINVLNQARHTLKVVILLDISESNAFDRLGHDTYKNREDRSDDNKEALQNVINEYKANTQHVIEYYRKLGLLLEVSGLGTREEVTSRIIDALSELTNK